MHIMPVTLLGSVGRAAFQRAGQNRRQMHCLMQQAVEQQPARAGRTPIEPKCEFVEVVIQVFGLHSSLMRPQQPAFQQGRYPVGQRQQILSHRGLRADDLVFVAQIVQAVVYYTRFR
jgi:hypothetical protein